MPLRDSGYVSLSQELWYALAGPLYNAMTWWCFLPLGGERRIRDKIVRWIDARPGHSVLSLCCGTGTTELALAAVAPDASILGLDLGTGQIAEARRRNASANLSFQVGDASNTGLPDASFDRVAVTLALHEMPAGLRMRVLREAARLCRPDGRVVCVEHGRARGARWLARELWWGTWVPMNPERETTHDLQHRGLDAEMEKAGLSVCERHATRWDWIEAVVGGVASSPA